MPIDWTQFFSSSPSWGSWSPNQAGSSGYTGPTGDIGYGTGVGAYGPIPAAPMTQPDSGQGWANMARAGSALVQPPQLKPVDVPMARPVGPGQLPRPQPIPQFTPEYFERVRQAALSSGFSGS